MVVEAGGLGQCRSNQTTAYQKPLESTDMAQQCYQEVS